MVLWPVFRLSQHTVGAGPMADDVPVREWPWMLVTPGRALADWLCLNLVFQLVVWTLYTGYHWLAPQSMAPAGRWTLGQTVWLDLAISGWSLLTGLIIAIGCRSLAPTRRVLAMSACVLLLLGEPLVMAMVSWLTGAATGSAGVAWTMRVSPLQAIDGLSVPNPSWTPGPWPAMVISVWGAGLLGWTAVLVQARRVRTAACRSTSTPALGLDHRAD